MEALEAPHSTAEGLEVEHFTPDAWTVALEATEIVVAPKPENKAAAEWLVTMEVLQHGMGWLLLSQIGVLLGSFSQLMPLSVSLLSFAIFMLEAILKFLRSWAHRSFFMGVPCAYVAIHEAAPALYNTLHIFEKSLFFCLFLELALYTSFIFVMIRFLLENRICSKNDHRALCDQAGGSTTVYLIFICSVSVVLHGILSFVTFWAFHSAMGTGLPTFRGRKEGKRGWRRCMTRSWNGIQHLCGAQRGDTDRIQCLTWWVHSARHRHLSAVVARAQAESCGLPGHWFETVETLKETVKSCVKVAGEGDHVLNLVGPDGVSLEMGLRALVSLAKQGDEEVCRQILSDEGFDMLVGIAKEGKFSKCRGLAAAAIGVLVTRHDVVLKANSELGPAVVSLKRLARSKEHELKEVALGGLLNLFLISSESLQDVLLAQFCHSDGFVGGSMARFVETLTELARSGPTTRCQELAMGLLTRLTGSCPDVAKILLGHDQEGGGEVRLLVDLLQEGQTDEIMVSAAGVLAELAFVDGRTVCRGPHGSLCIGALIQAIKGGDYRIAKVATRALANLAVKDYESRATIVHAEGVKVLVELLRITLADNTALETDEVQAEAARALSILSFKSPERQQLIAAEQAIPALVKLLQLRTEKSNVYIWALAALRGLAWENQGNQDLIREDGSNPFVRLVQILDDILSGKAQRKMEERLLHNIALAIRSFVENNRASQERLLIARAGHKLELILQKPNSKYKETTTKSIQHSIRLLSDVEAPP